MLRAIFEINSENSSDMFKNGLFIFDYLFFPKESGLSLSKINMDYQRPENEKRKRISDE